MKDKAGRPLAKGDYIVYGHALGRCAGLQYGVVIEIDDDDRCVVRGARDSYRKPELLRKGFLYYGERILKLEKYQIPDGVLDLLKSVDLT